MQDLLPIPTCFYSGQKPAAAIDPNSTKLGQSLVVSAYRTRMNGQDRAVTVTWCKNLLAHGLSVTVEGSDDDDEGGGEADNRSSTQQYVCRVEMRPWSFWRRHGSKRFHVEGMNAVDVFWDLRNASWYSDEPEPLSDYYVAVVHDDEVVLLLGDLKKDAFRRTGSRPSMFDAVLVSRREHVFGKRRFSTRAKFHDKGKFHAVTIEWTSTGSSTSSSVVDSDMVIKVDGNVCLEVKHLQWKFRGNESISVDNVVDVKVQVYWDVHDWLFSPGLRHALFIFKPAVVSPPSEDQGSKSNRNVYSEPSDYCLFLYAWKLE